MPRLALPQTCCSRRRTFAEAREATRLNVNPPRTEAASNSWTVSRPAELQSASFHIQIFAGHIPFTTPLRKQVGVIVCSRCVGESSIRPSRHASRVTLNANHNNPGFPNWTLTSRTCSGAPCATAHSRLTPLGIVGWRVRNTRCTDPCSGINEGGRTPL